MRAVGGGDARALLPAVLQRVEAEVGQVRRLGVAEDAEDAALVAELVEHCLPDGPTRPSRLRDARSAASRTTYSSAASPIARSASRHASRRPPTRRRRTSHPTAVRRRSRPITRRGHPGRAARFSTLETSRAPPTRRPATPIRRTEPPPASTARRCATRRYDRTSTRCRRCRSAFGQRDRQTAFGAIVRGSHQPVAATATSRRCNARSASRSSAGGTPRTSAVQALQVLTAAQLAAGLAQQHDRVAGGPKRRRSTTRSASLDQPDHPDAPASDKSPARRSRCRG